MQKGEELGTGFEGVKFERHKMYYSTREKEYWEKEEKIGLIGFSNLIK